MSPTELQETNSRRSGETSRTPIMPPSVSVGIVVACCVFRPMAAALGSATELSDVEWESPSTSLSAWSCIFIPPQATLLAAWLMLGREVTLARGALALLGLTFLIVSSALCADLEFRENPITPLHADASSIFAIGTFVATAGAFFVIRRQGWRWRRGSRRSKFNSNPVAIALWAAISIASHFGSAFWLTTTRLAYPMTLSNIAVIQTFAYAPVCLLCIVPMTGPKPHLLLTPLAILVSAALCAGFVGCVAFEILPDYGGGSLANTSLAFARLGGQSGMVVGLLMVASLWVLRLGGLRIDREPDDPTANRGPITPTLSA